MAQFSFDEDVILAGLNNPKRANPKLIGTELVKIFADVAPKDQKPRVVVDKARNPKHPLHPFFEWRNGVAAEKFRLSQARTMLRIIKITLDDEDEPVRAYISVTTPRDGRSYRDATEVRTNDDLQLALVVQAETDLRAFNNRYKSLQDVVGEAMEEVFAALRRHREEVRPTKRPDEGDTAARPSA